jgi:ATP-dependent exoDNAse (exonuclease V) beta subunit
VNKLNTLYVGFTRAEDELYVVGVQGRRSQFPIDLLKETDSQIGRKNVPRPRASETTQEKMEIYHCPGQTRFPFAPVESPAIHGGGDISIPHREGEARSPSFLTGFAPMEELNLEERLRGEFIHRVLYFIDSLDENIEPKLQQIIKRVNVELKTDYPMETMKKNLITFLNHEEIKPYFDAIPERVIRKEQDFSDIRGNLFRMDRVIFEGDQVSVIDYKTGTDKQAEKGYIQQLKNYIRILEEIYPDKKVEGVIAYVDLKEIKKVNRVGA